MAEPVRIVFSAASSASFSAGVPTVMRRQFSSSGCQPWRFFTRIPARAERIEPARRVGNARQHEIRTGSRTPRRPAIAASAPSRRDRSATTFAACSASSAPSASSTGATACVNALRLYGWRTLSSSAVHSGAATAYPSRRPAMPIFETVRSTSRFGNSATRGRKLASAIRVVRLVDHDEPRRGAQDLFDRGRREQIAGRVVGIGEKDERGPLARDRRLHGVDVEREGGGQRHADEAHAGVDRIQPVHHERRLRHEHRRARLRQRRRDELDQFVGSVAEDEPERLRECASRSRSAAFTASPAPSG